jgi:UDP-N-acetylmuramyl pentapeptide synthase
MVETAAPALWREDELLSATGGRLTQPISQMMRAVSIDSRAVADGDVFVAIKGDKMDGHGFAASALKAGAGVAIVSRTTPEMEAAGPLARCCG